MPAGHAPVTRELVVPIFRAEKMAIIGVGNKPSDYDEWDVEAVSLLGDLSWDITERKRAEEALRHSEASLAEAQRIAHLGNWEWDIARNELTLSDEIYRILDLTRQEFHHTREEFLTWVHPGDLSRVIHKLADGIKSGKYGPYVYRIVRSEHNQNISGISPIRPISAAPARYLHFTINSLPITSPLIAGSMIPSWERCLMFTYTSLPIAK